MDWKSFIAGAVSKSRPLWLGGAAATSAAAIGLAATYSEQVFSQSKEIWGAAGSVLAAGAGLYFGRHHIDRFLSKPRKPVNWKGVGSKTLSFINPANSPTARLGAKYLSKRGSIAVPMAGAALYGHARDRSAELLAYNDANYGYMKAYGPPRSVGSTNDLPAPSFRQAKRKNIRGGHMGADGSLTLAMHNRR